MLVNIARVLTVIAYRQTFFPEVESPQLHALMGLVWLLPAVALFVPRHSLKTGKSVLLEAVHLAAIIALLTPLVAGPGALIIAACTTMVWLERSKTAGAASSTFAGILWLLAGTLFASMAMESLWLAWLLACPWNGGLRWRRPSTAILLAGTMPLLSMRPAFAVVVGIAFAWNAWAAWLQPQNKFITLRPQPAVPPLRWAGFFALALAFVMPFAASAVSRRHAPLGTPPGTLHPKSLAPGHYELHLQDQPAAVRIDWFEPQGGGRHHTLAVCMRYRGCILSETPGQPDILTDGDCWRREYFLVGDHLCHGYREYLFKTMIPGSPTGAHLILATRCASMTGREFATISDALVRQIHEQVSAAPATIARS